MYDLLSKISYEKLENLVKSISFYKNALEDNENTTDKYIRFLLSYYGDDLLSDLEIRKTIIEFLPFEVIKALCVKHRLKVTNNKDDSVIILAHGPWKYESDFPYDIKESIQKETGFIIQDSFLPQKAIEKADSYEDLEREEINPLFDYQQEISGKLISFFDSNQQRIMLQMPTGSGKTRTVINALCKNYLNKNKPLFLWMAHTEELNEQAISTLKNQWAMMGRGLLRCYRFWGSYRLSKTELEAGIIFTSLQKFYNFSNERSELFELIKSKLKVIVFDEAHKAVAPTYLSTINNIMNKKDDIKLVGITATPGRSAFDAKENRKLSKMFDSNLITLSCESGDPVTYLRKRGILSNLVYEKIDTGVLIKLSAKEEEYYSTFYELPSAALIRLGLLKNRNRLIVDGIKKIVRKGGSCIVFACSVEHSKILAAMLNMEGIKAASVTSDIERVSRAGLIEKYRNGTIKVIVNYGILTTGFDAPITNAVVIARPTSSIVLYNQMLGRGLRGPAVGGPEICTVLDVMDNVEGFGKVENIYDYFDGYWNK